MLRATLDSKPESIAAHHFDVAGDHTALLDVRRAGVEDRTR